VKFAALPAPVGCIVIDSEGDILAYPETASNGRILDKSIIKTIKDYKKR